MSKNQEILNTFVVTSTVTFKAFDYNCKMVKSAATIWNFVARSSNGEKTYAVYCAPNLEKSHYLIRIAMKKINNTMRLVVVTHRHTQEQLESSKEDDYALVTLNELNQYGEKMIDLLSRKIDEGKDIESKDAAALATSREKVF